MQNLFGYSKQEMDGKNVAMMMPPPFSMQHHTFLRSYKQTQKGNLLGTGPREVIGAHRDGYVFPVKVTIEKSVGADGYTGVFHEVSHVLPCLSHSAACAPRLPQIQSQSRRSLPNAKLLPPQGYIRCSG